MDNGNGQRRRVHYELSTHWDRAAWARGVVQPVDFEGQPAGAARRLDHGLLALEVGAKKIVTLRFRRSD